MNTMRQARKRYRELFFKRIDAASTPDSVVRGWDIGAPGLRAWARKNVREVARGEVKLAKILRR
jgi:hypothetical protein